MASQWFYRQGEVKHGPCSTPDLKALVASGKLRRNDLVWKEGMADWVPAERLAGLYPPSAESPAAPAADPLSSLSQAAAAPASRPKHAPSTKPEGRRPIGLLVGGGAVLVIGVVALIVVVTHSSNVAVPSGGAGQSNADDTSVGTRRKGLASQAEGFLEKVQGDWICISNQGTTLTVGKETVVLTDAKGSATIPCTIDVTEKTIVFTTPKGDTSITAHMGDDGKLYCKYGKSDKTLVMGRKGGEGMQLSGGSDGASDDGSTPYDGGYKTGFATAQGHVQSLQGQGYTEDMKRYMVKEIVDKTLHDWCKGRDELMAINPKAEGTQRYMGLVDGYRAGAIAAGYSFGK